MNKKEYRAAWLEIEEKALATHVIGATAMALEKKVPDDVMQLLDRQSNGRRSSLAHDIVELELKRMNEAKIEAAVRMHKESERVWQQKREEFLKCMGQGVVRDLAPKYYESKVR